MCFDLFYAAGRAAALLLLCASMAVSPPLAEEMPSSVAVAVPVTPPLTVHLPVPPLSPPPQKIVVSPLLQEPELPTGCEATAAAMLLNAYGYAYSKTEVAKAIPCGGITYVNGRRYAPHPDDAFVGSPFSHAAYGVYAAPVAATMNTLMKAAGGTHRAKLLTGSDPAVIVDFLEKGVPVCVWVTMGLAASEGAPVGWYVQRDGVYTDDYFSWKRNEHCVVAVSCDQNRIYVWDPQKKGKTAYSRPLFFERYEEQGRYALILE